MLKGLVKRHEGLRLKPYRCTAGKLTIGYGRNLEDVGITEREADILLERDIAVAKQELARVLPESADLGEARYAALVDMVFNLGIARFQGFRKMIAAVKAGDFETAAREMLHSRWAQQVGKRAVEDWHMMKNDEFMEG